MFKYIIFGFHCFAFLLLPALFMWGWYDLLRLGELAVYTLLIVSFVTRVSVNQGGNIVTWSMFAWLLMIFFFGGLSLILSDYIFIGVAEYSRIILASLAVISVCYFAIGSDTKVIFKFLIASACVGTVVSFMNIMFGVLGGDGVDVVHLSVFENPRFFNQWQAFIIPLLAGAACMVKRFAARAAILSVLTLNLILMFITGGRGIIFAILVGIYFLWRFEFGGKHSLLRGFLFCLPLALVSYLAVLELASALSVAELNIQTALRTSSATRFMLWVAAVDVALSNFPLGVGPGLFGSSEMSFVIGFNGMTHPHNAMLLFAAEWGAPVAVTFVVLLGLMFKKFWQYRALIIDEEKIFFSSLVSALAYSCVSGVTTMPFSSFMFVVILGLNYQTVVRLRIEEIGDFSRKHSVFVIRILFLVAAILLISYLYWVTIISPDVRDGSAGVVSPGFWMYGRTWENVQ